MEQNMMVIPMRPSQKSGNSGTARIRRMDGYAEVELRWSAGGEQKGLEVFLLTSKGLRAVHPRVGTAPLRGEDIVYGIAAIGQDGYCVCSGPARGYEPKFQDSLIQLRLCFAGTTDQELQRARSAASAAADRDTVAMHASPLPEVKQSDAAAAIPESAARLYVIPAARQAEKAKDAVPLTPLADLHAPGIQRRAAPESEVEPAFDDAVATPFSRYMDVMGEEPRDMQEEADGDIDAQQPSDGAVATPFSRYVDVMGKEPQDMQAEADMDRGLHAVKQNRAYHTSVRPDNAAVLNNKPKQEMDKSGMESFYVEMQRKQRIQVEEQRARLYATLRESEAPMQFSDEALKRNDAGDSTDAPVDSKGLKHSAALQEILQRAGKIFPNRESGPSSLRKSLREETMEDFNDDENKAGFLPLTNAKKPPQDFQRQNSLTTAQNKKTQTKRNSPSLGKLGNNLRQGGEYNAPWAEETHTGRPQRCDNPFPHQFPGSSWVRVRRTEGDYYLEGRMRRGAKMMLIMAVPGRYSPVPPKNLPGFDQFIKTRDGGFWVKVMKDE